MLEITEHKAKTLDKQLKDAIASGAYSPQKAPSMQRQVGASSSSADPLPSFAKSKTSSKDSTNSGLGRRRQQSTNHLYKRDHELTDTASSIERKSLSVQNSQSIGNLPNPKSFLKAGSGG